MESVLQIFTDGGARGNPGPAASAFAIYRGEKVIFNNSKYLGIATNNEAEYNAVLLAYTHLTENISLYPEKNIGFYLDSELVVNQLSGKYKIKKDELINLSLVIKSLEKKIVQKNISYTFVRREKNVYADKLVNICIDENTFVSR